MKGYIIILVLVILFSFLWKFMIIAGIIWLILRKLGQHYVNNKGGYIDEKGNFRNVNDFK